MSGFLLALPFLFLSGLLVLGLNWWLGGGPAKFHDLTRPSEFVDQAERNPASPRAVDNGLAVAHYEARRDALGHGACREVRNV